MHASNRRRPAETERTRPCPERIRPGAAEAYKAYKTVLRIREQSDPFALGLAKVTPTDPTIGPISSSGAAEIADVMHSNAARALVFAPVQAELERIKN